MTPALLSSTSRRSWPCSNAAAKARTDARLARSSGRNETWRPVLSHEAPDSLLGARGVPARENQCAPAAASHVRFVPEPAVAARHDGDLSSIRGIISRVQRAASCGELPLRVLAAKLGVLFSYASRLSRLISTSISRRARPSTDSQDASSFARRTPCRGCLLLRPPAWRADRPHATRRLTRRARAQPPQHILGRANLSRRLQNGRTERHLRFAVPSNRTMAIAVQALPT